MRLYNITKRYVELSGEEFVGPNYIVRTHEKYSSEVFCGAVQLRTHAQLSGEEFVGPNYIVKTHRKHSGDKFCVQCSRTHAKHTGEEFCGPVQYGKNACKTFR